MAHLVCDHCGGNADIRRVSTCGSSWSCPVCSGRNSARRTRALAPQVERFIADGGSAHLLTLTLKHRQGVRLADSLGALSRAWSSMASGRAWQGLLDVDEAEWVRGFDVTYSQRHGWHPHIHVLLLLGAEFGDGIHTARALLARWRKKLATLGWSSSPAAQDHQRVDDPEKAAAYAVSPAAVYEPTAMAMKRARKNTGSRTPFEILTGANLVGPGTEQDKALWVEYVRTVKGRQQATCSKGLSFEEEPDGEAADAADIVAGLGREAVLELDKKGLTAPLLDEIEQQAGDPDGVRFLVQHRLETLESHDWRMFRWGEAAAEIERGREHAKRQAESDAMRKPDGFRRTLDSFDMIANRIPLSDEQQTIERINARSQARRDALYGIVDNPKCDIPLLSANGYETVVKQV